MGACIQCSVKTCKTAYHVTCAFRHNLEMRAIIEDEEAEDGVKLRVRTIVIYSISDMKRNFGNGKVNAIKQIWWEETYNDHQGFESCALSKLELQFEVLLTTNYPVQKEIFWSIFPFSKMPYLTLIYIIVSVMYFRSIFAFTPLFEYEIHLCFYFSLIATSTV